MAHIQFSVSGPFPISYQKHPAGGSSKQISSEHAKLFWEDENAFLFADKQGCYVFALRNSKGHTPWYVGKTKNALVAEIFTTDKLNKFNTVLFNDKKGTPVMFFVTRTDGRKNIAATMLNQLEKFLIQTAKIKNLDLINKVNTKNIEDWSIDGVYRPRQGTASNLGNVFKKMMGL